MKNNLFFLLFFGLLLFAQPMSAQRVTDRIDRGLVALKTSSGVFVSWRVLGEEYYDVQYNIYRDGTKLNAAPLSVSNYRDAGGTASSTYTIAPVIKGVEQPQGKAAATWATAYKEIKLAHEGIASTLVPNDACCADVDGDGELEILMKFDNLSEMQQSYPRMGPTVNGKVTGEYSIFEVLKLDGTRLWWVNCGPNMGDFQNNEQNIVAYDWDQDGKAEALMRLAEGSTVHYADGSTYTIGSNGKNGSSWTNYRGANGGGPNWFIHDGQEFLVYCNGQTGQVYQCITFPLYRYESGESNLEAAWGDGYGHRSSKYFFGAPYLDGRHPSIFLARGIYTRHKMVAYDVDPATHQLKLRWRWYNNTNGPWKGQGYHNYGIADVDWDGRDEIVFGSMVIDDNGMGLSTTGYGHGDAQHCSDFNPYVHGQEIFACNEDRQGFNYRDATTSKVYTAQMQVGKDVGRCMAGNFTNQFPGAMGTAWGDPISCVTNTPVAGLGGAGVNSNFRIYWDGDLCSETFNYVNNKDTEGCVAKYGSWSPIYVCAGSLTNNDTKGTPCYQGDILGDWREEIIMRTPANNIRIYTTTTPTTWRIPTLWADHQYRNAMVWQMCGYNQPPHTSYFLGEMEGITIAPPPYTMTDRTEVPNGGTIGTALDGQHAIVCETGNTSVTLQDGASPSVLTFNVPTWVQGSAPSECTSLSPRITTTTYTCQVSGGGLAGDSRLVKQGDGVLTLPKATFRHTGNTDVWAGVLNFDGSMPDSRLLLGRFAELNSDGGQFRSITAQYASVIRPGGAEHRGTMSVDTLRLGMGARLVADIYSQGSEADMVQTKVLNIENKTAQAWVIAGPTYLSPVIEVVGHLAQGEETMAPGKYVIAQVGEVVGNVSSIVVEGLATTKKLLYVEDGKLIVEIQGMRDPATIQWSGSQNSVWDFGDTENFSVTSGSDVQPTVFVAGDHVQFTDEASNRTVSITGSLRPASVTVDASSAYTLEGAGGIDGNCVFYKRGQGIVTMSGNNAYTGGNHLLGGTTKVSLLSNELSEVGNLGAITSQPSQFTIENGAVLQSTASVTQGSPMQMVGELGGVINAAADFHAQGAISGQLLTKRGAANLFLQGNCSGLKKVLLAEGGVAVSPGCQPDTIEVQKGTIWDDGTNTQHAIVVPKGKTANWQLTYTYYTAYANKLLGEGSLTIVPRNTVSRVRITGDWSQFYGTVRHTSANVWLPLDMNAVCSHMTLDIADKCSVANVPGRTLTIGAVTGKGNLVNAGCDFKSQASVTGVTTWKVGNSDGNNFTFEGGIVDNGGSNNCAFSKVGTCRMTHKGQGLFSGVAKVEAGELVLNGTGTAPMLGTGTLTVSRGAILSGKGVLGNSSVTVSAGAILRSGVSETSATGLLQFSDRSLTVSGTAQTYISSRTSYSRFTGISTLKLNGSLVINVREGFTPPAEGTEYQLFEAKSISLGSAFSIQVTPGYLVDSSRLATEGVIVLHVDPDYTAIQQVTMDQLRDAEIYTLGGVRVTGTPRLHGIYIVGGRKVMIR